MLSSMVTIVQAHHFLNNNNSYQDSETNKFSEETGIQIIVH